MTEGTIFYAGEMVTESNNLIKRNAGPFCVTCLCVLLALIAKMEMDAMQRARAATSCQSFSSVLVHCFPPPVCD